MVAVACGVLLAAVLFWLTVRQARVDGESPLSLALIPALLLAVAVPLTAAVWEQMDALRRLHESRTGGLQRTAALYGAMDRTLLLATVACLALAAVAMALQLFGAGRVDPPADPAPAVGPPRRASAFARWWLAAGPSFVVPLALCAAMVEGIPRLMLERGPALARAVQAGRATQTDLERLSTVVALRSLTGVFGGGVLSLLFLLLAMGNVVALRRAPTGRASRVAGWAALMVTAVLAVWNGITLASDLSWMGLLS